MVLHLPEGSRKDWKADCPDAQTATGDADKEPLTDEDLGAFHRREIPVRGIPIGEQKCGLPTAE